MRRIDRIDPFLKELGDIWKTKCPDWRFGQLMFNFISETGDPFHWSEEDFINKLKEYFGMIERLEDIKDERNGQD